MLERAIDPSLLRAIDACDDYRLLRRLEVPTGHTGRGRTDETRVGLVLDVETTGTGADDVPIELALRRFRHDRDGVIVAVDRHWSWLEDPGRELSPDIVELTGITDADLAGKAFDDDAVLRLLRSADWLCAHNAAFDSGMLVRRFPDATGLPWACSLADVDWRAAGFDGGRTLGWLLGRIGLFHGAHRAGDDVDAVIALLMHGLRSGRTVLAEMLERASAPSWRFRAVGAAFELRDLLRARGYRWGAEHLPKAWWREVPDADRVAEEWWLAGHVYSGDAHPKALGPAIERVTWRERYARPA